MFRTRWSEGKRLNLENCQVTVLILYSLLGRGSYQNDVSQAATESIRDEGCEVQLMVGDVTNTEGIRWA